MSPVDRRWVGIQSRRQRECWNERDISVESSEINEITYHIHILKAYRYILMSPDDTEVSDHREYVGVVRRMMIDSRRMMGVSKMLEAR